MIFFFVQFSREPADQSQKTTKNCQRQKVRQQQQQQQRQQQQQQQQKRPPTAAAAAAPLVTVDKKSSGCWFSEKTICYIRQKCAPKLTIFN